MSHLGVAWNSNVNKTKRRVCVAEGNDRNVYIRRLSDGLVILCRVQHNQETRLTESSLDL